MDSSAVNKEIKSVIRPILRDAGFIQFTLRTAWRYGDNKIDVLNFQSFNSYLANSLGCTTYSFCVRLGCSFAAIPKRERIKQKEGYLRPEEYECDFRTPLLKTIRQPDLKRRDVWYVDPSGQNLSEVIEGAKNAILERGLPWFNRFRNSKEVLRTLLHDPETNDGTYGFGANPSPHRHFQTGFIALSLNRTQLAIEHIQKAMDSGCFKEFEPRMRTVLDSLARHK